MTSDEKKSHCDSCDILSARSIREGVFKLLNRKPWLKPKDLCYFLKLDYRQYGAQVKQRRYEWLHPQLSLSKYGLGSSCSTFKPDDQHHVRAGGYVPKSLDRRSNPEILRDAVKAGWRQSSNRNRVLIWNVQANTFGRIEWWETGKINVHIRDPHTMGRVKQLLSYAFFQSGLIFDSRVFDAFMKQIEWKGWAGAHDVYDTPQKLPYRVIKNYEHLGFIIKLGDRSHPYSVEVEWVRPEWDEKLESFLEANIRQMQSFSEMLKDLSQPKAFKKDVDRNMVF